MEIGNDLIASLRGRLGTTGPGQGEGHPDWGGLQACFGAAHAARRALLAGRQESAQLTGSFDRDAAILLAGGHGERGVNRTDLVDGKYPGGIDGLTGGATNTGGRGQE